MIARKGFNECEKRAIIAGALLFSTILGVLCGHVSFAETYTWVETTGVVGFADSLQKVPEKYRQSAKPLNPHKSRTKPFQVLPSAPDTIFEIPPSNLDSAWQERFREARAELERLKADREAVQKQFDTFRAELYVRSFADPDADIQYRAKLAEFDREIAQKEYEISTAIPEEARKAGISPGLFSP
jgi:hypothetical protein